ncbi:MAG: right-handed parallel beta-helix repeat-containing protein [Candidatus Marinimicrobia bacterium]|nr:right-handed parallel beta-helix repeat-containing protein [Candidatus Neomarinimicrobiota bacterium]
MRRLQTIFLLLSLSIALLSAQTHISAGDVSGTWTQINSPYHINGNIAVPIDSVLTIEAGTSVYFSGEYQFDVYGQLVAAGTQTDSIFFYSDSLEESSSYPYYAGFWYGITMHATDSTGQDPSSFDYCKISYAYERWLDEASIKFNRRFGGGLIFYKSDVNVSNTKLENCYQYGNSILGLYSSGTLDSVSIINSGSIEILHSDIDISHSDITLGLGIKLNNANTNISNTKIHDNDAYYISSSFGVIEADSSNFRLTNCEITDNAKGGINAIFSTPIIENTTISGNGGNGGLFIESPATITNCEVYENNGFGFMFNTVTNWGTIYISDIQNTIIAKNTDAGLKFISNNGANITNCVIADNTSPNSWGGIKTANTDIVNVKNSIIYNNGSDTDFQAGGLYNYSIIQGNYVGSDTATSNLQNYDPLFRNTSANDYRLQSTDCGSFYNSPGIDAGDPTISDWVMDCASAGLGTLRSDIGAYGGNANWWDKSVNPPCHFTGNVSGIWECEDIYVDGNILIPEGDTLQIMSTVHRVNISGPFEIKVEGVLIAEGEEHHVINFEGPRDLENAWHGIVFNATNDRSVGISTLDYCAVFGANNINTIFPNGGALTIYNSDNVIVKNCHFGWNNAQLGGAVYIESSNPYFGNCMFRDNGREHSAEINILTSAGGAMYIKNSHPFMHDLQFMGNTANDGAAIFLEQSSPTMSNILAVDNVASGFASAVFINNSSPHIVNMTSANNIAGNGGGTFSLMHANSQPSIINSIMYGNSKPEIYINEGMPTVSYSIIDSAGTKSYFGIGCSTENPYFDGETYKLSYMACGSSMTSPAVDGGHPDSIDAFVDCSAGRGTTRADMGYYGGALTGISTAIIDIDAEQFPADYVLKNNYPNPFNPTTTISYILPKTAAVELSIYSLTGQKIQTLVNQEQAAGSYALTFDASNLASGVYFYRLNVVGKFSRVNKMILLK